MTKTHLLIIALLFPWLGSLFLQIHLLRASTFILILVLLRLSASTSAILIWGGTNCLIWIPMSSWLTKLTDPTQIPYYTRYPVQAIIIEIIGIFGIIQGIRYYRRGN